MTRERLYIYDTTLRDGQQTQGVCGILKQLDTWPVRIMYAVFLEGLPVPRL